MLPLYWQKTKKNDRRNSGGTLQQKINLIDFWHLTFNEWTNGPMDQWSNEHWSGHTLRKIRQTVPSSLPRQKAKTMIMKKTMTKKKTKGNYKEKDNYKTRRGNLLNRREVEERQGAILLPLLLLLSESVSSVALRPPASSYHANGLASQAGRSVEMFQKLRPPNPSGPRLAS